MRAIAGVRLARIGKTKFMQTILATFLRPVIHVEQIHRHVGKIQREATAVKLDQLATRVRENFPRLRHVQHGVRLVEPADEAPVAGFDAAVAVADGQAAEGAMILQFVAVVANRPPLGHPDAAGQRRLAAHDAEIIRLGGGSNQGRRDQK